jgi:hypothetical protein
MSSTLHSLPNLCVFEEVIGQDGYSETWYHGEIKALVTRSNYPLKTLILGRDEWDDSEEPVAEYITLIPSLKIHINTLSRQSLPMHEQDFGTVS